MAEPPEEHASSSEPTSKEDLEALFDAWDERKVVEASADSVRKRTA